MEIINNISRTENDYYNVLEITLLIALYGYNGYPSLTGL